MSGPPGSGGWWPSRPALSCAAQSTPTTRSPITAWTPWATSNYVPASKPKPGYCVTPKAIATHNTPRALARHLSDTLAERGGRTGGIMRTRIIPAPQGFSWLRR